MQSAAPTRTAVRPLRDRESASTFGAARPRGRARGRMQNLTALVARARPWQRRCQPARSTRPTLLGRLSRPRLGQVRALGGAQHRAAPPHPGRPAHYYTCTSGGPPALRARTHRPRAAAGALQAHAPLRTSTRAISDRLPVRAQRQRAAAGVRVRADRAAPLRPVLPSPRAGHWARCTANWVIPAAGAPQARCCGAARATRWRRAAVHGAARRTCSTGARCSSLTPATPSPTWASRRTALRQPRQGGRGARPRGVRLLGARRRQRLRPARRAAHARRRAAQAGLALRGLLLPGSARRALLPLRRDPATSRHRRRAARRPAGAAALAAAAAGFGGTCSRQTPCSPRGGTAVGCNASPRSSTQGQCRGCRHGRPSGRRADRQGRGPRARARAAGGTVQNPAADATLGRARTLASTRRLQL